MLCTVCKSALLLHCALLSENCGRQHNEQGLHVGDSRLHVYKSRLHVGDSRLHVDHSRLHVDNSRLHVGDSSLHVRRQEQQPGPLCAKTSRAERPRLIPRP